MKVASITKQEREAAEALLLLRKKNDYRHRHPTIAYTRRSLRLHRQRRRANRQNCAQNIQSTRSPLYGREKFYHKAFVAELMAEGRSVQE